MMFSPPFVDSHGVLKLNEAIEHFLHDGMAEAQFGKPCFPVDFRSVIRRNSKFEEYSRNVFKRLKADADELEKVREMWTNHSDICGLCSDTSKTIIFHKLSDATEKALDDFFEFLYETALKQLTSVRKACGCIKDHYQCCLDGRSMACPACCQIYLPDPGTGSRAAYDHYLNRSNFPLLSVNFKNLIPICDLCNGADNKWHKNVLKSEDDGTRRLAFAPYENSAGIRAKMSWTKKPTVGFDGACSIEFKPVSKKEKEQTETWQTVFGMKVRGEARVQTHHETWLKQFLRDKAFVAKPSRSVLRSEFRRISKELLKPDTIRRELDAVLKSSYFNYLANNASGPEIESISQLARGRMSRIPMALN